MIEEKWLGVARSLECSVGLFAAARMLYPETKIVYPVSEGVYTHVLEGTLEVASIGLPT